MTKISAMRGHKGRTYEVLSNVRRFKPYLKWIWASAGTLHLHWKITTRPATFDMTIFLNGEGSHRFLSCWHTLFYSSECDLYNALTGESRNNMKLWMQFYLWVKSISIEYTLWTEHVLLNNIFNNIIKYLHTWTLKCSFYSNVQISCTG